VNWVSKLLGTPYALNPDVANNDKFLMDREKNLTYWCVDKETSHLCIRCSCFVLWYLPWSE
jgi:hypothetical protein